MDLVLTRSGKLAREDIPRCWIILTQGYHCKMRPGGRLSDAPAGNELLYRNDRAFKQGRVAYQFREVVASGPSSAPERVQKIG